MMLSALNCLLLAPFLAYPTTPSIPSTTPLEDGFVALEQNAMFQANDPRRLQQSTTHFITELGIDFTEAYQPVDLVHTMRLQAGYFFITQTCAEKSDPSQRNFICFTTYNESSNQVIYQKVYGQENTAYTPIKSIQMSTFPYAVITAANINEFGAHVGAVFFALFPDTGNLYFYQRLDSSSDRLTDIFVNDEAIYLSGNNGASQQLIKISLQDQVTQFSKRYLNAGTSEFKRGLFWDPIANLVLISGTESSRCRDSSREENRYGTIMAINATTGNMTYPTFKFLEDKRTTCLDVLRFDNSYAAVCRTYRFCAANTRFFVGVIGVDQTFSQLIFGISYLERAENAVRIHLFNNHLLATIHREFVADSGPVYSQITQMAYKAGLDNINWMGYRLNFPTLDRLRWRMVSATLDAQGKVIITYVDQLDRRYGGIAYTSHFVESDVRYCGDLTDPYSRANSIDGDFQVGVFAEESSIPSFSFKPFFQEIADSYGTYTQSLCGPSRSPTVSPTLPTKSPTLRPTPPTRAPSIPPTKTSKNPSQTPTEGPSFSPTTSPIKTYQHYIGYKKSIEGIDIAHGISFFENRNAIMVVENMESGLWWMGNDESNQLIFAEKINVEGADALHPHGVESGVVGERGGTFSFSAERIDSDNERSLHFLVLDRTGHVQATAYLLGKNLAGYAQLIVDNHTYARYNARIRKSKSEECLLLGWYDLQPIRGRRGFQAYQSTEQYKRVWNRGVQVVQDGTTYGVSSVLLETGGQSLVWYYVLLNHPLLHLGRTRYVGSFAHNLHAVSFSVSQKKALYILNVPVKQKPPQRW